MNITLVQPRHSYAKKQGEGHIHLSPPLISFHAKLLHVMDPNTSIQYKDLNISDGPIKGDIIGINLVGAPYIPEVMKLMEAISTESTILLGGQIVSSLTETEFNRLFQSSKHTVLNGNNGNAVEKVLKIREGSLPHESKINFVDAYKNISDTDMKKYLKNEISFYVSQGCRFTCDFCQAKKAIPEQYRDFKAIKEDLLYLCEKVNQFGGNSLSMYISNLDVFQSPDKLLKFAEIALEVNRKTGVEIKFRGLATVDSFLRMEQDNPEGIKKLKKSGLFSIGFGVDGMSKKVWKSIKKPQNYTTGRISRIPKDQKNDPAIKSLIAIQTLKEVYDITPELLMVFGHEKDTEKSLSDAYYFCEEMYHKYGAIPRPHVAKNITPGADTWDKKENEDTVKTLLHNPELFQALDYTALPSKLSHPNPTQRRLIRKYYQKIIGLTPEHSTQIIYPNTPEWKRYAQRKNSSIEELNIGKFDR